MTREIIFRGKRTDTGEWVYGNLLRDSGLTFIVESLKAFTETPFNECLVNPDTVGQYIGLKDRDGMEIYEGDLLGSKGKAIGWVKSGVRGYCYDVVYIHHLAGESDWPLYSTVKVDYPEQIKVIGNIHDDPELLEEA